MIVRLVKMTFRESEVGTFQRLFDERKALIKASPGCHRLQLLHDGRDPRIFFTLSHWNEEADLEAYRQSQLFEETWTLTKALFDDKPKAWTLESEAVLGHIDD